MFDIPQQSAALLLRRRAMTAVNETRSDKLLRHPAPHAPRLFADTATIDEIRPLFEAGIINGVTTNPTLLKKAGAQTWEAAKEKLTEILKLLGSFPVSLELTKLDADEMIQQAEELRALGPNNAIIKVAIGGYEKLGKDRFTGLRVLRALWERDIKTNATLIFNSTQAFWAANAGATYVSPFLGRLGDYLYKHDPPGAPGDSLYHVDDALEEQHELHTWETEYVAAGGERKDAGIRLVREIAAIFANYDIHSEIIAASVRHPAQLAEAMLAGADILTVPAKVLQSVADHPLTDEGMNSFVKDAQVFGG